MRKSVTALVAALAIAGCGMDQNQQDVAATAAITGAMGGLTARMLGASDGWTAAAVAAAGTAGALARRHEQTDRCAYYTGNGDEVEIRDCESA